MIKEFSNKINPLQVACLIFISSITFKTIMLPQYLTSIAGRSAWLSILFLMLIDVAMFLLVFKVARNYTLTELPIASWLKSLIILLILFNTIFKFALLFTETNAYIASTLFDNTKKSFIVIVFLPVLAYIAYKGGNTLGRLSQLLFWLIAAATLFNLIFASFDGNFARLLPVKADGSILQASDRYVCWFGDFTPFLFFRITDSNTKKKRRHLSVPLALATAVIASVVVMGLFISVYGNASPMVANAFTKIALLNKLSIIIDTVDMPTVCSLMAQIVVKLSLLMYVMVECLTYFFKKRLIVTLVFVTALGFTLYYTFGNAIATYRIATSWFRYVILAIEYSIPMIVYIAYYVIENRTRKGIGADGKPLPIKVQLQQNGIDIKGGNK